MKASLKLGFSRLSLGWVVCKSDVFDDDDNRGDPTTLMISKDPTSRISVFELGSESQIRA